MVLKYFARVRPKANCVISIIFHKTKSTLTNTNTERLAYLQEAVSEVIEASQDFVKF